MVLPITPITTNSKEKGYRVLYTHSEHCSDCKELHLPISQDCPRRTPARLSTPDVSPVILLRITGLYLTLRQ